MDALGDVDADALNDLGNDEGDAHPHRACGQPGPILVEELVSDDAGGPQTGPHPEDQPDEAGHSDDGPAHPPGHGTHGEAQHEDDVEDVRHGSPVGGGWTK